MPRLLAACPASFTTTNSERGHKLCSFHGANREPAIEEQAAHRSPHRPELTGCPGDEDRSAIGHMTIPFAERSRSAAGVRIASPVRYTAMFDDFTATIPTTIERSMGISKKPTK